jgi:hypothetical protein
MNPNRYNLDARPCARLLALALALALSACGGGGGSPGAVGGSGSGGTGGAGGTGSTAPGTAVAASIQFAEASPIDKSIVIQGQGGINRTETATLKFVVIDTLGRVMAGRQVNFSVSDSTVHLNKSTDTTDKDGQVITSVNSGTVPTTFRVQATLPGTAANGKPDISTTSDSIIVTTGLPVQRAFSLSAEQYNLEGWERDSSPTVPATHIQVLLADAFGNPVPDGTPVVFQTNMGSVGSSSKGGCNTVNGGCSVDFRVQNPRVALPNTPATPCNTGNGSSPDSTRPGVVTVCASSNDGAKTLFSKINLFFGGSDATNVFLDGSNVALSGETDLGVVPSAELKVFKLKLADVNLNPLPVGTKVEVTGLVNATAAPVVPATVPNVFPAAGDTTGVQGTVHTFSIASTAPRPCTAPSAATFSVTVTTPANIVTNIPFKLAFSCP